MKRGSGVLLPIFALPEDYGIGTFGKEAYAFADFLASCHFKYWQMLPLNPTSFGDSPYQSFTAFGLNPYVIDLTALAEEGFLTKKDLKPLQGRYQRSIDYGKLYNERFPMLYKAYLNSDAVKQGEIASFQKANAYWVEDYALYMVMKGMNQSKSWLEWDKALTPERALKEKWEEFGFWVWVQYEADLQYKKLKAYVNSKGLKIIGDIPIYVALDSADCYFNPQLFQLGVDRKPSFVAG